VSAGSFTFAPLAACAALFACSAPRSAPIDERELVGDVLLRGEPAALVARALELAEVEPLALKRPDPSLEDPDGPDYWRACALAWAAEPVTARRELLAARALRGGAGLPNPIGGEVEVLDLGEPDRQSQLQATFDLLGILGLGRGAASRELAGARERRALAEVELAAWRALHRVDRARLSVAAGRARERALAELRAEVRLDERRIDVLEEHGWLPAGGLEAARAMIARLDLKRTSEGVAQAGRLAELARASGLPPTADMLARLSEATLDRFDAAGMTTAESGARSLLGLHPDLRARRLDYAVAEARVRRAAAERWPDLAAGPRLSFAPDQTLVGGALQIAPPWPGSTEGEIGAALERRELARELLEDALAGALAEIARRRDQLALAGEGGVEEGRRLESGTRAAWRAARAGFSVEAGKLPQWTDGLERRIAGVAAAIDAREGAALALVRYREAVGPQVREEGEVRP